MPLILDNILVFLWRTGIHWFRKFRCRNWPVISGTIDNIACPEHEMYPYVEIHFLYTVAGNEFDARRLRGFWYSESARNLADAYARTKSIKVRYSPGDPAKSYLWDEDQVFWR